MQIKTKNNDLIIDIKNLYVGFGGTDSPKALNDFHLQVFKRDKIAIIGETGSGKSVMLQALLRLLPKSANIQGNIYYQGKNLLMLERKELDRIRGNKISYVPQGSGNSLNPLLSIGFQISEPLLVHKKISKKNMMSRAIELMKKFNLGNEEQTCYKYPHTFSGGMKQRALIAMGISTDADVILADEPTKGLDNSRIEMVKDAFKLLADKTIICVTHDINFATEISNILCIMYSSELLEEGKTQEVINNPLHPYTQDIIAAMPENGLRCKQFNMRKELILSGCKYINNCIYATERCKKSPPLIFFSEDRKVRCWKYAEN